MIETYSHLHSIQHGSYHRGDGQDGLLVVQVDVIISEHDLVGPADEVPQALVDPVQTRRHGRADRTGKRLFPVGQLGAYNSRGHGRVIHNSRGHGRVMHNSRGHGRVIRREH